jgi:hypothetical protein
MRALQQQDRLSDKIRMASVCPGWAETQIAGRQGSLGHFVLNSLAFDRKSWGLASTFYAFTPCLIRTRMISTVPGYVSLSDAPVKATMDVYTGLDFVISFRWGLSSA